MQAVVDGVGLRCLYANRSDDCEAAQHCGVLLERLVVCVALGEPALFATLTRRWRRQRCETKSASQASVSERELAGGGVKRVRVANRARKRRIPLDQQPLQVQLLRANTQYGKPN